MRRLAEPHHSRTARRSTAKPEGVPVDLAFLLAPSGKSQRSTIHALQRTIGNAATSRILQRDTMAEEKQRDEDRGDRRSTDRRRNRGELGLPDPFDNFDSDW